MLWNKITNGIVEKTLRFRKGAVLHVENESGTGVTEVPAATLRALNGSIEITGARTVLASESGSIFYINNATGFITTLPTAAAGLRYTFINKTANTSGNHTVVSASSANIIKGNQNSVAGDAGDFGTADDTISFVANQSIAGDKVEVFSDGTSWFAYAISKVAAGVTFTQAS